MKLTAEEIDAAKTAKGGWDRATLAAWGVDWPPPKGWRQLLIDGKPMPRRGVDEPATAIRPSACLEAKLLRALAMAVIEAGQGDIISALSEVSAYFGTELKTVEQVIGGRPENAIITGGISFDDLVYSFRCERVTRLSPSE